MPLSGAVSDSTDPATLRSNLPLIETPGSQFIPLELPFFENKINLPPHVKSNNVWGIFELFFSKEQVEYIVKYTNEHVDHSDLWELGEEKPKSRLY